MPCGYFSALPGYDAGRLIQVLWDRWQALLERYDGGETAATDPVEHAQIHVELLSKALLLCAIRAPTWDALQGKARVASWLNDHGGETWTAAMAEVALASDALHLKPANDIAC